MARSASMQLVWFRNDLRVVDQVALAEAAAAGPVVAVYCLCPDQLRSHDVGGHRVDFLLRSLAALGERLDALGMPLRVLECGDFAAVPEALLDLAREIEAEALWFNDEYPLNEQRRDEAVERSFREAGIGVHRCTDGVIQAPGTVLTGKGDPYTVFTPFRRRWVEQLDPAAARPRAVPARQARPGFDSDAVPGSLAGFTSDLDAELWPAGEDEAERRLQAFVDERIGDYAEQRDLPAMDGTSSLSPYLSVGAISPRQCLDAAMAANDGRIDTGDAGTVTWVSELIWREFYRHVVAAFPHVSRGHAFRRQYDAVRWRRSDEDLQAWCEGRTGFPLVDAGMRQLRATGWMHNRLRMVTAMFLSKNLLLDWRLGERWFMQQLVDGDFAANNGGWQWSASTGTDAAPYFRIFNPVTQSQRFDPDGRFLRHWLPELADVKGRAIHDPDKLDGHGGYPRPIVDYKASRERALEAFKALGD